MPAIIGAKDYRTIGDRWYFLIFDNQLPAANDSVEKQHDAVCSLPLLERMLDSVQVSPKKSIRWQLMQSSSVILVINK